MSRDELFQIAHGLAASNQDTNAPRWNQALAEASVVDLIALMWSLRGGGVMGQHYAILREQVQATINRHMADQQIAAAHKLEKAANRLGKVGLVLAVVAIIVGLPGAVLGLQQLGWWLW